MSRQTRSTASISQALVINAALSVVVTGAHQTDEVRAEQQRAEEVAMRTHGREMQKKATHAAKSQDRLDKGRHAFHTDHRHSQKNQREVNLNQPRERSGVTRTR